jgi:hypothetical protein
VVRNSRGKSGTATVNLYTPASIAGLYIFYNNSKFDAAGSTVTINPISGGPLSATRWLAPVPEPSTLALLIAAATGIIFYLRR